MLRKASGLANGGGGGEGLAILYTEPNFKGESKKYSDSDPCLTNTWGKKPINSLVIDGNPWCFYGSENMKGVPVFLEQGRYDNTSKLSLPTPVGSMKYIDTDMETPELLLSSSTDFKAESSQWTRADFSVELMRHVSVGPGGIFAIKAKDDSVWYRTYDQGGKPHGKVLPETDDCGTTWSKIPGTLRQLSVGSNCLWGVSPEGRVIVRLGISPESPAGREWVTVDAEPMKQVSVSPNGHVWGIDNREKIWFRKGACQQTPLGQTWKSVSGNLKQISVGNCGVWGVNSDQIVYFRLNTYGDGDTEGTGWLKIEGKFQHIYSGEQCVIALAGNRDIYFRANVYEKQPGESISTYHEGSHWVRIEQNKESKIIFRQVESAVNTMWAVDKDNTVWFKKDANIEDYIKPDYSLALYGDVPEFSMYKFPMRASTYKVISGGWALYSEQNFQGKIMYHFGNDCLSNDPPNKENPYKSFYTQIGSARPIRGKNYSTPIVKIKMSWDKIKTILEKEVLFSEEITNKTEQYMDAPWNITFDAVATVYHRFELRKAQSTTIRGCEFNVDQVDPLSIPMENAPDVTTGAEFHEQLVSLFTFKDETHADRESKKTQIIKLPPLIPPRCIFKVEICMYRGKFQVPFNAEFKFGFPPNFETGIESWNETGFWEGEDESNIKLEISCEKMPTTRKVSKMLNGIGEDM